LDGQQMRVSPIKFTLYLGTVLILALWFDAGFAQKLVDPNSVAPEFRAAEKRRAEQIKLRDCSKQADQAKVLPRDRSEFVGQCLER
jgi:hypothetical protein